MYMNTHLLIALIVAAVVIGGGFVLFGQEKAEAPAADTISEDRNISTVTSSTDANVNETFSGTGSFSDLVGLGNSITCDFSHEAETGSVVAGTVKVADGKMRSDFAMQQAGTEYQSHFIQDASYFYTWSDGPQGSFAMKAPIEEVDTNEAGSGQPGRPVDMDSDVEYECRSWRADASVFVPPSDITFMTPDMLMQNMMQQYR